MSLADYVRLLDRPGSVATPAAAAAAAVPAARRSSAPSLSLRERSREMSRGRYAAPESEDIDALERLALGDARSGPAQDLRSTDALKTAPHGQLAGRWPLDDGDIQRDFDTHYYFKGRGVPREEEEGDVEDRAAGGSRSSSVREALLRVIHDGAQRPPNASAGRSRGWSEGGDREAGLVEVHRPQRDGGLLAAVGELLLRGGGGHPAAGASHVHPATESGSDDCSEDSAVASEAAVEYRDQEGDPALVSVTRSGLSRVVAPFAVPARSSPPAGRSPPRDARQPDDVFAALSPLSMTAVPERLLDQRPPVAAVRSHRRAVPAAETPPPSRTHSHRGSLDVHPTTAQRSAVMPVLFPHGQEYAAAERREADTAAAIHDAVDAALLNCRRGAARPAASAAPRRTIGSFFAAAAGPTNAPPALPAETKACVVAVLRIAAELLAFGYDPLTDGRRMGQEGEIGASAAAAGAALSNHSARLARMQDAEQLRQVGAAPARGHAAVATGPSAALLVSAATRRSFRPVNTSNVSVLSRHAHRPNTSVAGSSHCRSRTPPARHDGAATAGLSRNGSMAAAPRPITPRRPVGVVQSGVSETRAAAAASRQFSVTHPPNGRPQRRSGSAGALWAAFQRDDARSGRCTPVASSTRSSSAATSAAGDGAPPADRPFSVLHDPAVVLRDVLDMSLAAAASASGAVVAASDSARQRVRAAHLRALFRARLAALIAASLVLRGATVHANTNNAITRKHSDQCAAARDPALLLAGLAGDVPTELAHAAAAAVAGLGNSSECDGLLQNPAAALSDVAAFLDSEEGPSALPTGTTEYAAAVAAADFVLLLFGAAASPHGDALAAAPGDGHIAAQSYRRPLCGGWRWRARALPCIIHGRPSVITLSTRRIASALEVLVLPS